MHHLLVPYRYPTSDFYKFCNHNKNHKNYNFKLLELDAHVENL